MRNLIIACCLLGFFLISGCGVKKMMAEEHLKKGKKFAQNKEYKRAAEEFYTYIKMKPKDPQGYMLLARTLEKMGKIDEEYTILKKAKKNIPKSEIPDIGLARFYISRGMNEKAKALLREAEKKNPKNLTPQYMLGLIYVAENNNDKAYKILSQVITHDPNESANNREAIRIAYTFLLEIIGAEARTDKKSLEIIEKAIKFMPDYSRGYTVLGIYYYKKGEYDKAMEEFQKALAKDPDREAFLYKILGNMYEKKGEKSKALHFYVKFLKKFGKYGRDKISPKDAATIRVFVGIDKDVLNLKQVRQRVKLLKGEGVK